MLLSPTPINEAARLAAVRRFHLDRPGREAIFDHATDVAAGVFDMPISLVSIVAEHMQYFKGAHGLTARSTPREVSFCAHALISDDVLVVKDASRDQRFSDNPMVLGPPHIRFYAGAPLKLQDGTKLGTICLIDRKPRTFDEQSRANLTSLAMLVVEIIELRLAGFEADEQHRVLTQMQEEFISTTSHELRTPLTSIIGSLGLIQGGAAGELPAQAQRMVRIAHASAERLVLLVNDVLDLAKLAHGEVVPVLERLDVGQMLLDVAATNEPLAREHGIELSVQPTSPDLAVIADSGRTRQVLTNLLSNAVTFSTPGSPVLLSAAPESAARVRFSISDTGCGIADEDRQRIFEKFVQAKAPGQRQRRGTGLGLAIAKELTERMGGEIGCESVLGAGSTFFVLLPRVGGLSS